jgi:hypothetical protein
MGEQVSVVGEVKFPNGSESRPLDEPAHDYDHLEESDPEVDNSRPGARAPDHLLVDVLSRVWACDHPTFRRSQRTRYAIRGDRGISSLDFRFLTGGLRT